MQVREAEIDARVQDMPGKKASFYDQKRKRAAKAVDRAYQEALAKVRAGHRASSLLSLCNPLSGRDGQLPDSALSELFASVDLDASGTISAYEMAKVRPSLRHSSAQTPG